MFRKAPIERVCRALCRHHGHSGNGKFDGRPIWETYRDEAIAMLWALKDGDRLPNGLLVKKEERRGL